MVFLDVGMSEALLRIGVDSRRPLLAANPQQQWRTHIEERRPLYIEVASAVVNTAGRNADEVAQAVLDVITE